MVTIRFRLISVLLAFLGGVFHAVMADDETGNFTALQTISQSNLNFTTSLYKVLTQNEGNLLFSPLSIQVVLTLTYMGAGGETAKQMLEGLSLPQDKELTKAGFTALFSSLTCKDEPVTLEMANKIYLDTRVKVKEEFQSTAEETFKSSVENVDFANATEEARVTINDWVEEKTDKKIQQLFAEGILNQDTLMVLVNAVYFKGEWATQFNPKHTTTEPFYLNTTLFKEVEMMRHQGDFDFSYRDDLDGAKILKLPYAGGNVSMVVVLPEEDDGLAALEEKLSNVTVLDLMKGLHQWKVLVQLPKFKLEEFIDLNKVLQQLGMVEMFEDSADFSGLFEEGPSAKVSKVVQKTYIEVNEEGTEAAAATGVVTSMKSMPLEFIANHPFVFYIVDKITSAVLFAGRYAVPT